MSDSSPTAGTLPSQAGKLRGLEWAAIALISLAMLLATWLRWWETPLTEVLGFITGGACVWLAVREHMATWPMGLANNLLFFVLFWQERLFADASLQIVFAVLAVYGWWSWLYGGVDRTELSVARATRGEWIALAVIMPLSTWGLHSLLVIAHDAAPFLDAMTSVLSLGAQFLMSRKRLEHWALWIIADVIYIPLYMSRHLTLTAVLYAVFLVMCMVGWREWRLRCRPLKLGA